MKRCFVIFCIAFLLGGLYQMAYIYLSPYIYDMRKYEELPDSLWTNKFRVQERQDFLRQPDSTKFYYSCNYHVRSANIFSDDCLYALIMSNRFESGKACYGMYALLQENNEYYMNIHDFLLRKKTIYKTDSTTQELAIHFLKKGAKQGDSLCIKALQSLER